MHKEVIDFDEDIKVIDESKQGDILFYDSNQPGFKKFYIESYGCQMNFSDSEIVASILAEEGYVPTKNMEDASLILVNTCSIREKAEETVRNRLVVYNKAKQDRPGTLIGVLGCMAERLKSKLMDEEKLVDLVVGPDAYRDIPGLLSRAEEGERSINVLLSREETYADISPLRLDSNGIVAFISIMRGCDNMCSFCVVPFTRGRERSRDWHSIVAEADDLFQRGFRDITLLGQNVDSYHWTCPETGNVVDFAQLLEKVALVNPLLRIRFSTSHPKDITDEVLYTMNKYHNICKYIHLPVQSGSNRILQLMNRTYTREWYMERIDTIYRIMPDCAVSSDIIAGFCTESDDDHRDTLEIMKYANFNMSYMFFYSERPGTLAARKFQDDIPLPLKKDRLAEIVELQRQISIKHNQSDIGKVFEVLIEGDSKKSSDYFKGRNSQNKMVVFPKSEVYCPGAYVNIRITNATGATLLGEIIQ